jgi:hypothetical protein
MGGDPAIECASNAYDLVGVESRKRPDRDLVPSDVALKYGFVEIDLHPISYGAQGHFPSPHQDRPIWGF